MPQPKPTPQLVEGPGGNVTVWASDVAALRTFFPDSEPITSTLAPPRTVAYTGNSARQYPGDSTPVSRSGGNRQIYPERWLSNGTTPGTVFWCETSTTDTNGKPVKRRKQFTYQGAFGDLKAAARAQAVNSYVLRNASGAAYPIGPVVPPGVQAEVIEEPTIFEELVG